MTTIKYLDTIASRLLLGIDQLRIIISANHLSKNIRSFFGDNIEDHFIFGSFTRRTLLPRNADPCSDVDYMLVFQNTARISPQTYLNKLKTFAQQYYPRSIISQSYPAIRIELSHIMFELVPSYKTYATYQIPSPTNYERNWIATHPNRFNGKLRDSNADSGSKTKKIIRLMKYWNAVNGHPFCSYNLETWIASLEFSTFSNLLDCIAKVFKLLNASGHKFSDATSAKVGRANSSLNKIVQFSAQRQHLHALLEIKKLFPNL